MTHAGSIYLNSVTGERALLLLGSEDTGGEFVRAELWARPHGRVAGPHKHPHQTETFEVLGGRLGVRLGTEKQSYRPGDKARVPPGTVHDWWAEGNGHAHVLLEVRPARRFEEMIVTVWGLAMTGRTNSKGIPGVLQLALLAQEFEQEIAFESPPLWVQRSMARILAPVARLRGLKGSYPELADVISLGRAGEKLTLSGQSDVSESG
jgi:quercetin dioxygenase-like cupin family protein